MPNLFHEREEIGMRRKPDPTLAKLSPRNHLSPQLILLTKIKMFSHPDLPSRTHQALPLIRCLLQLFREQHLNASLQEFTSRRILYTDRLCPHSSPPPIQPGRKHARVIEDDQITGPQQFRRITKLPILQPARFRVQMQKARRRPVRQGLLGNQFFGKVVVELRYQHAL